MWLQTERGWQIFNRGNLVTLDPEHARHPNSSGLFLALLLLASLT